ncbi:ECF transporter S component [Metabacillus sp. GX 13764]|uniref:ECF transporter S component n=1 Tax=Metabacillus kandeliae TaxID=2900151 RepID=UPI001E53660E|nr:ECF transporter S component [Metabacillus kandeliae]MCD7033329.1 ECF transporter S component [Metabacillus kandeliae]
MVVLAALSSVSFLLMMLEIPYPGFVFLNIDFSDVPAIIAAVVFGPAAGIIVEGLKNILHYLIKSSATGVPVGELANFISGVLYILPIAFIYKKIATAKGVAAGLALGTLSMTVIMSILNYYVIFPAYTLFMNFPAMPAAELARTITAGIIPFNIVKGILVAAVFLMLYGRLKTWLSKQRALRNAA